MPVRKLQREATVVPVPFVIAADHPSLPGHFPGRPVVPGVVMLDRVLDLIESLHPAVAGAPLRLPQVKFLQPLLPEQTASIELQALAAEAPLRWRFRIHRGDSLLASGEVLAGSPP